MRLKIFSTQLGRWHSIDKLAENYLSQSPYSYAGNNPINYVDLYGLWFDNAKPAPEGGGSGGAGAEPFDWAGAWNTYQLIYGDNGGYSGSGTRGTNMSGGSGGTIAGHGAGISGYGYTKLRNSGGSAFMARPPDDPPWGTKPVIYIWIDSDNSNYEDRIRYAFDRVFYARYYEIEFVNSYEDLITASKSYTRGKDIAVAIATYDVISNLNDYNYDNEAGYTPPDNKYPAYVRLDNKIDVTAFVLYHEVGHRALDNAHDAGVDIIEFYLKGYHVGRSGLMADPKYNSYNYFAPEHTNNLDEYNLYLYGGLEFPNDSRYDRLNQYFFNLRFKY